MAKEVIANIKLQIKAGQASPAPPIGPALGPYGLNIMDFCKAFNDKTKTMGDTVVPVILTAYKDRSFSFITKTPPASELLKKAAGIIKGSSEPNKNKVAKLTLEQINEIAQTKLPDLNASTLDKAVKIIRGTARSMGIDIIE
jgi:large subunit ribosomal protein L11